MDYMIPVRKSVRFQCLTTLITICTLFQSSSSFSGGGQGKAGSGGSLKRQELKQKSKTQRNQAQYESRQPMMPRRAAQPVGLRNPPPPANIEVIPWGGVALPNEVNVNREPALVASDSPRKQTFCIQTEFLI